MKKEKLFHLSIDEKSIDGAQIAIIPGAPERAKTIASLLERPKHLSLNREYNIFLGYIENTPVVVCSTGIGGPSTSIAVEELAQIGVRSFIRVGTTGAIQPHIEPAHLIISQASVRLDGASLHFAPLSYPAASDFDLTTHLVQAAKALKMNYHVGITASSDTFYPGQERYDTYTAHVAQSLKGSLREWQSLGVLNYEMETATLFTMCSSMGLKSACVAGVLVNRTQKEIPDTQIAKKSEQNALETAILAIRNQILNENNNE